MDTSDKSETFAPGGGGGASNYDPSGESKDVLSNDVNVATDDNTNSTVRRRAMSMNQTGSNVEGASGGQLRRLSESGTLLKPSSSIQSERQSRLEGIKAKRANRTSKHIDRFIKLTVIIGSTQVESFDVTIDKTNTIEQLAHQIEAQYAFRASQNVQEGKPQGEPLEIGQVYNSGMLALKFQDVIGEVLEMNDSVTVINAYHGDAITTEAGRLLDELPEESSPTADDSKKSTKTISPSRDSIVSSPTMDDRLMSLLYNKLGLAFFHEFCIEEFTIENLLFWLDVETFQTCDEAIRPTFGRYIYLVYIAQDAPLLLNLSKEVRQDVAAAFDKNDGGALPVSVFDEAQQNVYAMIKGHSYIRFEKSSYNKYLQNIRKSDLSRYRQSRISGAFSEHFHPNPAALESLNQILESPTTAESLAKLVELGDGKPISIHSNQFKELFISSSIQQYFPASSQSIDNYFDQITRIAWGEKQRKMLKERKLHKFFGTKISSEQLERQVYSGRRLSGGYNPGSQRASRIPEGLDALLSEEVEGEAAGDGADSSVKRKKMEKLHTFFGDFLPDQERVGQNLVSGTDLVNIMAEEGGSSDGSCNGSTDEIIVDVATTNDLDADQKRMLTKRNKKLNTLLGEALDAKTVSRVVTDTVQLQKPADGSESHSVLSVEANSPQKDSAGLSPLEPAPGSTLEGESNQVKKKRLDKLSSVFGQRIKADTLTEAQSYVPMNLINSDIGRVLPAPRVLTGSERKQVQRRANKIEKLLGAIPPTEALITTVENKEQKVQMSEGPGKRVYRNIASLSFIIENTADVVELLETLTVVGADSDANNKRRSGYGQDFFNEEEHETMLNNPEAAGEASKEVRQKKLQKLRKFFGDDVNIYRVIEQQIFAELEKSIEEEVKNEKELEVLRQDMASLRQMVLRRSAEFEVQLREPQYTYESGSGGPGGIPRSLSFQYAQKSNFKRSPTEPKIAPKVQEDDKRRLSNVRKEVWEEK
ncbi:hypothetical protein HDV05_005870 [Chytridiales sp. JEL 0842]|nr:hypothetical protein HDV05_005870 [Chytridiales sp. JEL 0842]